MIISTFVSLNSSRRVVMSNSANICQTFQPRPLFKILNPTLMLYCDPPQWKLFVWCGQICIFNYAKNYTVLLALLHNLCPDYFTKEHISAPLTSQLRISTPAECWLRQILEAVHLQSSNIRYNQAQGGRHWSWVIMVLLCKCVLRAFRAANLLITLDSFRRQ